MEQIHEFAKGYISMYPNATQEFRAAEGQRELEASGSSKQEIEFFQALILRMPSPHPIGLSVYDACVASGSNQVDCYWGAYDSGSLSCPRCAEDPTDCYIKR